MYLTRNKTILAQPFVIGDKKIKKIELREYEIDNFRDKRHKEYSIKIYLETENNQIEMDYLGHTTTQWNTYDEISNFLVNYNGLTSTINRILIELDGKIRPHIEHGS
ncbi:MAG: hypothetical protein AB7V56_12990 [Candidatus Nitrosocosmicus sp.]|nr:hypothetical protein [Candidatus Nitrosocosmicus sp.]